MLVTSRTAWQQRGRANMHMTRAPPMLYDMIRDECGCAVAAAAAAACEPTCSLAGQPWGPAAVTRKCTDSDCSVIMQKILFLLLLFGWHAPPLHGWYRTATSPQLPLCHAGMAPAAFDMLLCVSVWYRTSCTFLILYDAAVCCGLTLALPRGSPAGAGLDLTTSLGLTVRLTLQICRPLAWPAVLTVQFASLQVPPVSLSIPLLTARM
jgi:hypothetical protein